MFPDRHMIQLPPAADAEDASTSTARRAASSGTAKVRAGMSSLLMCRQLRYTPPSGARLPFLSSTYAPHVVQKKSPVLWPLSARSMATSGWSHGGLPFFFHSARRLSPVPMFPITGLLTRRFRRCVGVLSCITHVVKLVTLT